MNKVNWHRVTDSNPCGCGYRDFNTDKHEPCCNRLNCPYSSLAREHDALITHISKAMWADRENGADYDIAIENPMGSLRKRFDILTSESFRKWVERKTVDYCAYKHEFQKRTDIFTSLKDWNPSGLTGTGLCEGRCPSGSKQPCPHNSEQMRYRHYENMYNVQGKDSNRRKNAVPYMLLKEIIDQARRLHPNQKVVIDLCSGYQSMQQVVEDAGLVYIPVDIKEYNNTVKKLKLDCKPQPGKAEIQPVPNLKSQLVTHFSRHVLIEDSNSTESESEPDPKSISSSDRSEWNDDNMPTDDNMPLLVSYNTTDYGFNDDSDNSLENNEMPSNHPNHDAMNADNQLAGSFVTDEGLVCLHDPGYTMIHPRKLSYRLIVNTLSQRVWRMIDYATLSPSFLNIQLIIVLMAMVREAYLVIIYTILVLCIQLWWLNRTMESKPSECSASVNPLSNNQLDNLAKQKRITLWRVIALTHTHHTLTTLTNWNSNYREVIARRQQEDARWAQWACECMNSQNGRNPFMLD
jgi:hypothetical protein